MRLGKWFGTIEGSGFGFYACKSVADWGNYGNVPVRSLVQRLLCKRSSRDDGKQPTLTGGSVPNNCRLNVVINVPKKKDCSYARKK